MTRTRFPTVRRISGSSGPVFRTACSRCSLPFLVGSAGTKPSDHCESSPRWGQLCYWDCMRN
ncbi:unnamed protein product [Symbiodinium sp. CCMP2456]|nr:unnamed protein product [Symbiodinium sp. CCMP2456]